MEAPTIIFDLVGVHHSLDQQLSRGCNMLHDYLVTHPTELEKLEVCQNKSTLMAAVPFLVKEGEEQARDGNVDKAVETFRQAFKWNPLLNFKPQTKAQQLKESAELAEKGNNFANDGNVEKAVAAFQSALKLDPSLDFNPETKARQLAASALVSEGNDLAKKGDINGAIAKFQKALQLDHNLDFEPETKARQLAVLALLEKGESLVSHGKVKEAIASYAQAQKVDPKVPIPASSWNKLCKQGSLLGAPADVMFACEKAVALAPDYGWYLNSRGIARALTGDKKGAIEDFQAFIAWSNIKDSQSQWQRWIDALNAGQNPFTPEEIKHLFYLY